MIAGLSKAFYLYLAPVLSLTAFILILFSYLAPVILFPDQVALLTVSPSEGNDGPSIFLGALGTSQVLPGLLGSFSSVSQVPADARIMTRPLPAPLRRCHPPTVRRLWSLHARISSSTVRSLCAPEQRSGFALGPYRDDSCVHCSIPRVHDHLLPSVHHDVFPREDGQVRQRLRQACHPTHDGVDRPPRFPHWCASKQLSLTRLVLTFPQASPPSSSFVCGSGRLWRTSTGISPRRVLVHLSSLHLLATVSSVSILLRSILYKQNTDFRSSGLGWLCLLCRSRRLLSGQTARCRRQGIGSMR